MDKTPCPARKPCVTARDAIGRDHVNCLVRLNYCISHYMGYREVISQCAQKGSMQCLKHHLHAFVRKRYRRYLEHSRAYMRNVANMAAKRNRLDVLQELRAIPSWCLDGHNIYSRARDRGNCDIVQWCLEEGLVERAVFDVASLIRSGNLKMIEWVANRGPVEWPADCYWDAFRCPVDLRMAECLWRHGAPLGDIVSPNKYGDVLLDFVLEKRSASAEAVTWLCDRGAQWTQKSLACAAAGDRDLAWMLAQGCPVGSKELLSIRLSHRVSQLDWAVSVPLELDTDAVIREAIRWGVTETLDWLVQRGELTKGEVDVSGCLFAPYREDIAKWKTQ
ncbi:hypothetical protein [Mollivirus kamchatka]|nr:hypothetical protein [Mollivirus kamchatka]